MHHTLLQVLPGNVLLPHVLEGQGPFDAVLVGADASADQLPALLQHLGQHGEAASMGAPACLRACMRVSRLVSTSAQSELRHTACMHEQVCRRLLIT